MTTAQRIKDALISYLQEFNPDESISIVDGKQRAEIAMPTLAVDVTSVSAHSVALSMVHTATVQCVLRCHAGDESDADIPAWIDAVESLLFDVSGVKAAITGPYVLCYDFTYNGSEQEWDESTLEVTFSADCVFAKQ